MTDSTTLDDPGEPGEEAVTRRGRLQRRLRRQRRHAARDALIGAAVTAVLTLGGHAVGTASHRLDVLDAVAVLAGAAGVDVPIAASGPSSDTSRATASDNPSDDDESAPARFSAVMVGDVMFGRHVERAADRLGYRGLLEPAAPHLDADYVSGNLEQVVSDRDDLPEADKIIHLSSGPEPLDALADAGINLVTLANNHAMDHGIPGLNDTIAALDDAGIDHVGAGADLEAATEIHYGDHDGLRVATVSFTDTYVEGFVARAFQGGVLDAEPGTFGPLIQQAQAEADLVVAQFHWGEEYDIGHSRHQRELAEEAAAAGADIVVGHHPHVLMPVERIDDTLVFFSLGNFVFDQGWSRTRETAVARYELGDDGQARVELRPMWIREATPRPLEGASGAYRRARIFNRLRGHGLDWERDDGVLTTEIDHSHVLEGRR